MAIAAALLTAAALLLPALVQGNVACPTPAGGDYDSDDDGLIEVCSLAQLNAIRWDADGNGSIGNSDYEAAFPDAASGMGCPSDGCNGYELTADLDFDTNGNGEADAGDTYWNGGKGWLPIHYGAGQTVVFEGNDNTISNLFLNRSSSNVFLDSSADFGLFGRALNVNIRNVGLESVDVNGRGDQVGGLVGLLRGGEIRDSYVTGWVAGHTIVGGLAGWNQGSVVGSHSEGEVSGGRMVGGLVGNSTAVIRQSYSTANVSATGTKRSPNYQEDPKKGSFRAMRTASGHTSQWFGGLVGSLNGKILGSYATGDVTAGNAYKVGGLVGKTTDSSEIVASYAAGDVSNRSILVGGLVGWNWGKIKASYSSGSVSGVRDVGGLGGVGSGVLEGYDKRAVVTASYWDTETSGQSLSAGGTGKTTSELQAPTGYAGIYADWNVDLDGDGNADTPWDFGTASQYPVLKDAGPSVANQREQMQSPAPRAHLKTPGPADSLKLWPTPDTLTVSWKSPLTGGMPTGYVALLTPADGGDSVTSRVGAYELDTTFRSLATGSGYSVSLRAVNQAGEGEAVTGQVTLPDTLPEGAKYWPNPGCKPPATGDYDTDDDGLIEICSWLQLNAKSMDMDGDGIPSGRSAWEIGGKMYANINPWYARAFPNPAANMGCPASGCIGYELITDLDLSGHSDYRPGFGSVENGAIFEGNGHTISNVNHNKVGWSVGLFNHNSGVIRNLGLVNVKMNVKGTRGGDGIVGALVAQNRGVISNCYVTGEVSGPTTVGGMVGRNAGTIINSWTDVDVTGNRNPTPGKSGAGGRDVQELWDKIGITENPDLLWWIRSGGTEAGYDVGGLVGYNEGQIRGSYALGDVSGKASNTGGLVGYHHAGSIRASYAAGNVSSSGRWVGGLIGSSWGNVNASYALGNAEGEDSGGLTGHNGGTITASYWNTDRSRAGAAFGAGKTTSELQTPTDYAGIYAGWNVDLGSDGNADDPWDFGTDEQYPVLKGAGPSVAKQRQQIPPAPEFPPIPKPDSDADGLIEVSTLAQLNAVRWDLDGDGSALETGYAQAFIIPEDGMGCPDTGCVGYELAASLNFDTNGNGRADAGDAYWNGGAGWSPIGSGAGDYAAIFEGNDYTIRNLHISSSGDDVGLFDGIASGGSVRNLTLEAVMVSGVDSVGGLAGENAGTVSGVRISGTVWGRSAVGGLAGSSSGVLANSQSRASVMGTKAKSDNGQDVGGLVGYNSGSVRMSYATGKVSGKADNTGGLAGRGGAGSSVIAGYATGNVSSTGRYVGGLVGHASGGITASYAAGGTTGGADAGGLAGHDGGTVADSYWDSDQSQATGTAGAGKSTAELQAPTGYEGIYANWNVDVNGDGSADDPWQFGSPLEYPKLKGAGATPMPDSPGANQRAEVAGLYSVSAPASVAEGETVTLTISLSDAAPANGVEFTVKPAYDGDNAAQRYDVGKFTSSVTVPEGSSAQQVDIPTIDNGADRPDKTLTLVVTAVTPGWMKEGNGAAGASITVRDNDAVGVTVSPATVTLAEGGTATYTVVLDAETDGDVFITPSSGDVGAVTFTPASVRFTPSSWSWPQTFTVSGVADADAGDESVTISHRVTLGRSSAYSGVTAPPLTVTVSDTTPRNFSVSSAASASEGSDATLTVTLSAAAGAVEFGVSAGYQSGTGKAVAADVGSVPQTVTVAAGETTASLAVPIATDALTESDETFTVTLTPPTGWAEASLGAGTATVTITDVPPEPEPQQASRTYSITASASAAEGSDATLTITLSEAAPAGGVAFTVTTGYSGQTAVASDVGTITSPVTVLEGNTTLDIAVPTVGDDMDEADEIFTVTIVTAAEGWAKEGSGKDTATVTITDDDTAGITVTSTTLNVSETGTATYTVVLDSQPAADVTVTPSSSDDGAATVAPASYTFTPTNWNTAQTFTVSGVADGDTDDESVAIGHQATSQDASYSGIIVNSVAVTVTDTAPEPQPQQQEPDPAAVELPGPVENLQVSLTVDGVTVSWDAPQSGGAPDKYIVRLSPADGGKDKVKEPKAGKTSVTFGNPEAGATYQVKVRAQNGAGKGDPARASVTVPELPGPTVNLQLLASADSITATWEAPQSGGTPSGYLLNIKKTGSNQDESRSVAADIATATFSGLEAGATYRVWVRAVNAGGKGERVRATVTLPEAPQQQEPEPDPDPQPQQTARTYAVTATASAVEGSDATLTITLSEAAPAGGVAFTVTVGYSGQTAEAADVGSITSPVTVLEGDTTLEITVPTTSDDVDEADETFTVTVAASTEGWEKEGDGKDAATVTIADDDTAGVTVSPTTLDVSEAGTATYTVVLDSQPTADVTVAPSSSDDGAATFTPASYTFTATNWNTAQTFTVSGVADDDRDDESVSISHSVASSDGKYSGMAADSVTVAVSDTTPEPDPEPGTYSVTTVALATEGTDATLTITLSQAAPVGGVEFTVTADYGGDATATSDDVGAITSPATVLEGDTTLDIAVPTVGDDVDEDDETFTVTITASTSGWEKEREGKDTATVTIWDDDTAGVRVSPWTLSFAEDSMGAYAVWLASKPSHDVTITPTVSVDGVVVLSQASLTFTPENWDENQLFIVSGVVDDDADDETLTISHQAASQDDQYDGIAVRDVEVTVEDGGDDGN